MSDKEEDIVDDLEDEEGEGSSSSGEEEDEENGEEDSGDEDDGSEDDEEGDENADYDSSSSEDENAEKCAICLAKLRAQQVGTPESCDHTFCLECIQEWAKNVNTCPVDRQTFNLILARSCLNGSLITRIKVENKQLEDTEEEDLTFCEVCGRSDGEDRLLLCDGCDLGFHCGCLDPPLEQVPVEEWFCPDCAARQPAEESEGEEEVEEMHMQPRRRIARTRVSERVRRHIRQIRTNQAALTQALDTSSEEEEEDEVDEPYELEASSSSSVPTPVRPKRKAVRRKSTKRKTTRKRKSASKKPRKRKTTRRTKRRSKKKRKRVVKSVTPSTVKKRLASRLGLVKPPVGRTMPLVKNKGEREIELQKADIGAAPLSILGHKDDLDSLDTGSDCSVQPGTSGTPRKRERYSESSRKSRQPIGRPRILSELGYARVFAFLLIFQIQI